MSVENDLTSHFGDYLSDGRRDDWELLKSQIPVLGRVIGKVVARYPFGVFLDIGVGFPALLLVPDFEGAAESPYTSMDQYPALGATAAASLPLFVEDHRQMRLIQRPLSSEELATIQ
jgi:hypothetical protein